MTWNAERVEDTEVPTPTPEPLTLEERVAKLEAMVDEHETHIGRIIQMISSLTASVSLIADTVSLIQSMRKRPLHRRRVDDRVDTT